MKTVFVRTTYIAFTAAVLTLTGCSDNSSSDVGADKLSVLSEGTPRDSVLMVMGQGPLTAQYADTMRLEKGFRRETYLINGKQLEVLYYRELQGNVAEPVVQAKETPLVLQGGKLVGWGWKYYVEIGMPELDLPNPTGNVPGGNGAPPAVIEMNTDSGHSEDSAAVGAGTREKTGA